MKYYVLDTEDRLKIYFLLALLSAALMIVFGKLAEFHNYIEAIAPSGLMIYLGLITLFDKFMWKWPLIGSFVGVPVLSGNWEGTLI
ncbi:MAG: hypothetical protein GY806_22900 [Gammaproteobacteria bacterium]|nr:hypothetical protein [Gammaproteobacteria bacterium]